MLTPVENVYLITSILNVEQRIKGLMFMKIGVVGYGVVGKTVAEGFRQKGYEVLVNDLKIISGEKAYEKSYIVANCDLVFICVPTPPRSDGAMDLSSIEQAVDELSKIVEDFVAKKDGFHDPIVVIKSTVIPGTTRTLAAKFPLLKFAFNPEFLRMKHALDDFLNECPIIIGVEDQKVAERVAEAYKDWSSPVIITDFETAETIKLVANCFLTYKVAFACEVANFCKIIGVDAQEVMDAISLDDRIGNDHLDPSAGPIPRDSHCLPKDLFALINYLESNGYRSRLLMIAGEVGIEPK
jgi:UDPglucose 6-dehydrogenase